MFVQLCLYASQQLQDNAVVFTDTFSAFVRAQIDVRANDLDNSTRCVHQENF